MAWEDRSPWNQQEKSVKELVVTKSVWIFRQSGLRVRSALIEGTLEWSFTVDHPRRSQTSVARRSQNYYIHGVAPQLNYFKSLLWPKSKCNQVRYMAGIGGSNPCHTNNIPYQIVKNISRLRCNNILPPFK